MSRTLKCHNLDDAEKLINRLNNQMGGLSAQIANTRVAARREAHQIANERVRQAQEEIKTHYDGVINKMQRQMEKELNKERNYVRWFASVSI